MLTTLIFLLVLSILVFVHELGHFLVAKMFNIRVDEFAIGFPPKIYSKTFGETTYSINALPLGGYVKIHGENPEDIEQPDEDTRSFQHVSWWKQVLVLIAGVTCNIIFAWILVSVSLMIGTSKASTEGVPEGYIYGTQSVIIQSVIPKSPAEISGLKAGYVIQSIQGVVIKQAKDVQSEIQKATSSVTLVAGVTGKAFDSYVIIPNKKAIGVSLAEVATVRMPFIPALWYGAEGTYNLTKQLGSGVIGFFGKLFVGNASFDEVSGPVGIAKVVGGASREGFVSLLFVAALISISLAIMNILPFPALDGGRIAIALVEGIIRKRLNTKFVNGVNTIGFLLLIALMIVVTVKDVL